jgi:hypothetical protein
MPVLDNAEIKTCVFDQVMATLKETVEKKTAENCRQIYSEWCQGGTDFSLEIVVANDPDLVECCNKTKVLLAALTSDPDAVVAPVP